MIKETEKIKKCDIMEGMPSISSVIKAIENGHTDRKILTIYIDITKKRSKSRDKY